MPNFKHRGVLEMNLLLNRHTNCWVVFLTLACLLLPALEPSVAQSKTDDQIKKMATADAMMSHDHSNHFKKKLLEFVAPVYNQPLVHSSLISSLDVRKEGASAVALNAADRIASIGADSMQMELQGRLVERSVQLKILKDKGMPAPGMDSTIRAGKLWAKVQELKAKEAVWTESVTAYKTRNAARLAMHVEGMKNRIDVARIAPIIPGVAKRGEKQNDLLRDLTTKLLTYGSSLGDNPAYQEVLEKLVLPEEDFDRILLAFDDDGREFIFPATKGARDLGKPPLVMNHPEIVPVLRKCETMFKSLGSVEQGGDLYEATYKMSDALRSLDEVCDKVIGTRRECAARDSQTFRMWQKGQDYRNRLRGLLNRIQLVGSTEILGASNDRFDPRSSGCGVLAFAKFVADSGCRFAPAASGDELVYVRLQAGLLQLQAIIGG